MSVETFENNPVTVVLSGGTDAPASGTVETWTVSNGSVFPAASSAADPPTQFHVADIDLTGEVIAVTNTAGNNWTVTRGAEGSTPAPHASGFSVTDVVSAGTLGNFVQTVQMTTAIAVETTRAETAEAAFIEIGGDIGGTVTVPEVIAIQGTDIEVPSGNSAEYLDGTGNWSTPGGTGLSNPMTALGDVIYGGTSGTPARLAGNLTAAKKFLTETGTGSASAAPGWNTIVAADLPAATTGAAGAVQLAGDLGGTSAAPEVLKIQGTPVSAPSGGATAFLSAAGSWAVPAGTGSGLSNPMTTEGDLIVGGSSGTPQRLAAGASGYVFTSGGPGELPSWQAAAGGSGSAGVPTYHVYWMDELGADHTGATSVTTLFNTQLTAADGAPCVFIFGVGTYLFETAPNSLSADQSIAGFGSRVTNFTWSGSGPLFTAKTASVSGTWNGSLNGGSFTGFSITGPYGSVATSSGIKYGALQGVRIDDVGFYGLPGGAVLGYVVTTGVDWAEEGQITRLDISECGAQSGFIFSFNGTSFDYSRIDALVVVEANIDVVALNGAEMQGLNLALRGNLHGGTSNTGAIISMDRASSSTVSVLGGGCFAVSMEADDASAGGAGDVGHYTVYLNSSSAASQFEATGTLFAYNEGSCQSQGVFNPNNLPCALPAWTNALDGTAPPDGAALTAMGALLQTSANDGFGTFYDNNVFWEFGNVQTATLGAGAQTITFDSPGTFILQGTLYLTAPTGGTTVTWQGSTVAPATSNVKWIGTALTALTADYVYKVFCDYLPVENVWYLQNAGDDT